MKIIYSLIYLLPLFGLILMIEVDSDSLWIGFRMGLLTHYSICLIILLLLFFFFKSAFSYIFKSRGSLDFLFNRETLIAYFFMLSLFVTFSISTFIVGSLSNYGKWRDGVSQLKRVEERLVRIKSTKGLEKLLKSEALAERSNDVLVKGYTYKYRVMYDKVLSCKIVE